MGIYVLDRLVLGGCRKASQDQEDRDCCCCHHLAHRRVLLLYRPEPGRACSSQSSMSSPANRGAEENGQRAMHAVGCPTGDAWVSPPRRRRSTPVPTPPPARAPSARRPPTRRGPRRLLPLAGRPRVRPPRAPSGCPRGTRDSAPLRTGPRPRERAGTPPRARLARIGPGPGRSGRSPA